MNSKWLDKHEEQTEMSKAKGRRTYIRVSAVIMSVLLAFYILGLVNKMSMESHIILGMIILTGIIIISILYRILYRKGDPFVRRRLKEILKTQEEVDEFDLEMISKPLFILKLQHKAGRIIFTEHYLVEQNNWESGIDTYNFIKRDNIKTLKIYISSMARMSDRVCDRKFKFVCRNSKNKLIGVLTVYRKVDYLAVKEAIINIYPKLTKYINEEIYYDKEVYNDGIDDRFDQGGRD